MKPKLVRDRIFRRLDSKDIAYEGRHVSDGEELLALLREKLIEEAGEVKDAVGPDDILEELADVQEVVDCLVVAIGFDLGHLFDRQDAKRKSHGGFVDGCVLTSMDYEDREFDLAKDGGGN